MSQHWAKSRLEVDNNRLEESCQNNNPDYKDKKGFGSSLSKVIRATTVLQAADSMSTWEALDTPTEQKEYAQEYYDLVALSDEKTSYSPVLEESYGPKLESLEGVNKAIDEGLAPNPKDVKKAQGLLREGIHELKDIGIKPDKIAQLKTPGIKKEFFEYHVGEMASKGPSSLGMH